MGDKEINIKTALECVKELKEYINRGVKNGGYDIDDIPPIVERLNVMTACIDRLDKLQMTLNQIRHQHEFAQRAEQAQIPTPK